MLGNLLKGLLVLSMSLQLGACASRTTWKEEVLLHDGSKIIVERSHTGMGRHEFGRIGSPAEQDIVFAVPQTGKKLTFKSEYSDDIGGMNFYLLALHISNGTPYIITYPYLCLSYNKWGRPNPPYVIFRHDGTAWQRIALKDLPTEFKDTNLIYEPAGTTKQKYIHSESVVSAETIKKLNRTASRDFFKSILRAEIPDVESGCSLMLPSGRGGWYGTGNFGKTHEECLVFCEQKKFKPNYCPCDSLFGEKK